MENHRKITQYPATLVVDETCIREIKRVIFNDPTTTIFWNDGTKTVVKCQEGDTFDPEKGFALAITKRREEI